MTEKEAKFRLVEYQIVQSHFDIKIQNEEEYSNLAIEVERQNGINEERRLFRLDLLVRIKDDNDKINISVEILGLFEFDSDINTQLRDNFFMINAPAILFPHVRAYVSALTALSGFKPIILPTINFAVAKLDKTE